MGSSFGKMERSMKESLSMISVKAKELSPGLMADNILESGRVGNNMEKEHTYLKTVLERMENGTMAERYNG